MRLPLRQRTTLGRIDSQMTPMIDVVFLLLIFFLVTATFTLAEGMLPTHLPRAQGKTQQVQPHKDLPLIKITLIRAVDGAVIQLNGTPVTDFADLEGRLRQLRQLERDPELPVIIDAEPAVLVGTVVQAYDSCLVSGFKKISFAAPKE